MPAFEFIIHQKSVSCTNCDKVFATPINQALPDMSKTTPVESDLHRILPYGAVRASMVTICPFCQYAWWASTFSGHFTLPIGIPEAPAIEQAKKFAHAVFTGRKNNYHVLDRAMLALNGYWCAQECHDQTDKWLALAIQELTAALAEQNWTGNRARYHYILAELLRRQGEFDAACKEFDLVDESANLPADLIKKQKQLTSKHENHSVSLTKEEVEKIFFPVLKLDPVPEMFRPIKMDKLNEMDVFETESSSMPLLPIESLPARKLKTAAASAWSQVQTAQTAGR